MIMESAAWRAYFPVIESDKNTRTWHLNPHTNSEVPVRLTASKGTKGSYLRARGDGREAKGQRSTTRLQSRLGIPFVFGDSVNSVGMPLILTPRGYISDDCLERNSVGIPLIMTPRGYISDDCLKRNSVGIPRILTLRGYISDDCLK